MISINFKYLRYFWMVAQAGSIARASEPLPDSFTCKGILLVPFAPCLLSCLRIKHPATGIPAKLDTRPMANGFLGEIRTR